MQPRVCERCGSGRAAAAAAKVFYLSPFSFRLLILNRILTLSILPSPTEHKHAEKCSGKRDRTAFLGRGQLDERSLLSGALGQLLSSQSYPKVCPSQVSLHPKCNAHTASSHALYYSSADYRFLEEIKLADDVAKRAKPPAPKADLPQFLQSLVHQARRRGVQLHILPPGMERRKVNSTRYDGRQQLLSWRVEWQFVGAGCATANGRVSEHTPLGEVLRAHLAPAPGASLKSPELQKYADRGADALTLALRKERTPADVPTYHRLDPGKPLGKALQGKVVVEFPVVLVLLPEEAEGYTFVEVGVEQQNAAEPGALAS